MVLLAIEAEGFACVARGLSEKDGEFFDRLMNRFGSFAFFEKGAALFEEGGDGVGGNEGFEAVAEHEAEASVKGIES